MASAYARPMRSRDGMLATASHEYSTRYDAANNSTQFRCLLETGKRKDADRQTRDGTVTEINTETYAHKHSRR